MGKKIIIALSVIILLITGVIFITFSNGNRKITSDINQKTIDKAISEVTQKNTEKALNENDKEKLNSSVANILKAQESAKKIAEPYLRVDTQNIGNKIIVSYVDFNKNSFVVIKKPGTYGGEELMGISNLLPVGKNENFEITLNSKVAGTALTAYLFEDNGDGVFNESSDSKALDPRNNLILTQDFDVRTR